MLENKTIQEINGVKRGSSCPKARRPFLPGTHVLVLVCDRWDDGHEKPLSFSCFHHFVLRVEGERNSHHVSSTVPHVHSGVSSMFRGGAVTARRMCMGLTPNNKQESV